MKKKYFKLTAVILAAFMFISMLGAADTQASESGTISATTISLAEIDAKANALKEMILNSKTEINVTGTIYYVSNKGDDSNDGKSPEKAWSTLSKVTSAALVEGDAVLFERGGTYRGNIIAMSGVTYSAFGEGNKPQIIGSLQNYSIKEKWKETNTPNVYFYDQEFVNDAGVLIFNNGEAYSYKKIIGIDMFTGTLNELKSDLEMYHSVDDNKIYVYSDKGNPADRFASIEFCLKSSIIRISGDNITIDNLSVKYGGGHAINSGGCKELKITNCEIGWIGGSILKGTVRYGNAVEVYGSCDGYVVDNCYIYQIYDAGITNQYWVSDARDVTMKNIKYMNNLIEYCTWSIEYALVPPAQGTSYQRLMSNIAIKYNIFRNAGYGWGNQRPNKITDAHIKSYDLANPAENITIENNIFDRSIYMLIHIGAADVASLPKMIDNTYIQYQNGLFGKYRVNPTVLMNFDSNIERFIKDVLGEVNPVVMITNNPAAINSLSIAADKTVLQKGDTALLTLTGTLNSGTVADMAKAQIVYTSDKKWVAAVNQNGVVTAVGGGIAKIKVAVTIGGMTKEAELQVTVEGAPAEEQYETVTLTVKPDGTGDFLSPKLANDSFTDSSAEKRYVIEVYPGEYTETNWIVKPYTTIRGTDKDTCWLKGEFPESATNNKMNNTSTIWLKDSANLENLKITCKNMKYPVQSEASGMNMNAEHNVKNCYIEHYGNLEAVQYRQRWVAANPGVTPPADLDPAKVWGGISGNGSHAWGYGSASGVVENFYDSTFVSKDNGWYVRSRENFTMPQINIINNCKIVSTVTSVPITVQSLGSGTKDQVIFNNCEITGTYMRQGDSPWVTQKPENQYANHADYTVTFNNCTPIGYMDSHRGRALSIFSNSIGSSSYVRVSGDAVADILGQYITKDGGGTLKGYIYGYWDISGIKVGMNSDITVNNTLGRRLGNCTTVNKSLNVTFEDGTTKNIIFNENYTEQTNAYVLAKINDVLGSFGSAAEYNVTGKEYYPEVIDKQMTMTNNTSIGIPRFSAVCYNYDTKSIRLMKSTDSKDMFLGITLEGIAPGQSGRVLTEGIMHKYQLNGISGTIAAGTKISISFKDGNFELSTVNPVMQGINTDWAYFKGNMATLDSLSIMADKAVIKTRDTASLTLTGKMSDGTAADLTKAQVLYTSDNEQVALVDQNGTVTAVSEGTAKIITSVKLGVITKETEIQIMIDATPAVTVFSIIGTSANGWYNSDVTITLASTDSLSGVEKMEYRLSDSSEWIEYTTPVTIIQHGNYTVQYRSTDKAGNIEETKQETIKIDNTAPVTTATINAMVRIDGTYNSHAVVALASEETVSGSGVAGIEYCLDETNWLTYMAPLELTDNGTYSISYKATDNAGNIETVKNVSIIISMNPDVMVSYLKEKVNLTDIDSGIKNSLISKLDSVLSLIMNGDKYSSHNQINAFINEVDAQSGKKLTIEQADGMKTEVIKIIDKIN